jgi:hypothetical protein
MGLKPLDFRGALFPDPHEHELDRPIFSKTWGIPKTHSEMIYDGFP